MQLARLAAPRILSCVGKKREDTLGARRQKSDGKFRGTRRDPNRRCDPPSGRVDDLRDCHTDSGCIVNCGFRLQIRANYRNIEIIMRVNLIFGNARYNALVIEIRRSRLLMKFEFVYVYFV